MNETNATACVIEANPDVSGTGIRASIYALCLGGHIFSFAIHVLGYEKHVKEFDRSVKSALSIQGVALLCTAVYQTFRTQLTLFHAICVLHLIALVGLNVVARGEYKGNEQWRRWFEQGCKVVVSAIFIAFNVFIWVKAPVFGSQPTCNKSTLYVVFGVSIHATAAVFRWIILATFSIVPAILIIIIILGLPCLVAACCCGGSSRESIFGDDSDREYGDQSKGQWVSRSVNLAAYTAFTIYAIVSLEQTIDRNNIGSGEREWTFGQVIALFLLLGTVNEMINVFIAGRGRRSQDARGA